MATPNPIQEFSIDNPLNPTLSAKIICNELRDAMTEYFRIGLELGIKGEKLKAIELEHHAIERRLWEIIHFWLENDENCTWRKLIAALKTIGRINVATNIERRCKNGDIKMEQHNYPSLSMSDMPPNNIENSYSLYPDLSTLDSSPTSDTRFPNKKRQPLQHIRRKEEIRFPYLDTAGLSKADVKELSRQLTNDTSKIIDAFSKVVCSVFKSFEKNISAEALRADVITFGRWSKSKQLRDNKESHIEELENVTSVRQIQTFLVKHNYISFINFKILKQIIEMHGSRDDEKRLDEYLSKFTEFCNRSVFEVPSKVIKKHSPDIDEKLVVKVSDEWFTNKQKSNNLFTMHDLFEVQCDIEEITGCSFVLICGVKRGCVQITFAMLSSVLILPLSEPQIQALSDIGITVTEQHTIKISEKMKEISREFNNKFGPRDQKFEVWVSYQIRPSIGASAKKEGDSMIMETKIFSRMLETLTAAVDELIPQYRTDTYFIYSVGTWQESDKYHIKVHLTPDAFLFLLDHLSQLYLKQSISLKESHKRELEKRHKKEHCGEKLRDFVGHENCTDLQRGCVLHRSDASNLDYPLLCFYQTDHGNKKIAIPTPLMPNFSTQDHRRDNLQKLIRTGLQSASTYHIATVRDLDFPLIGLYRKDGVRRTTAIPAPQLPEALTILEMFVANPNYLGQSGYSIGMILATDSKPTSFPKSYQVAAIINEEEFARQMGKDVHKVRKSWDWHRSPIKYYN